MAVEKLDDGTYRVDGMTFGSAEQAFEYDQARKAAPTAVTAPAPPGPVTRDSQWSRMSNSSRAWVLVVALTIFGVFWVGAKLASTKEVVRAPASAAPAPSTVVAMPAVESAKPATAPEPPRPLIVSPTSKWEYKSSEDKMTSRKSAQALIVSDNELDFGFPYRGPQNGWLAIRRHPQYGLDVIVGIEKGQMMCHTYDCSLSVRFDDGPPMNFTGTEPADHSSQSIFLSGADRFIAAAKKANRILVQFNAYQNGSPVLEFTSRVPLEWPPK